MIHIATNIQTMDVQKIVAKVAQKIKDKIIENIKNGINNDGEPFIPYQSSYAKIKGQTKVDLKVTGRLLNSFGIKFKGSEIMIGVFGDRNQIAEYLNLHKNWSFLKWGKLLDDVYRETMKEAVQEAFNGGMK